MSTIQFNPDTEFIKRMSIALSKLIQEEWIAIAYFTQESVVTSHEQQKDDRHIWKLQVEGIGDIVVLEVDPKEETVKWNKKYL